MQSSKLHSKPDKKLLLEALSSFKYSLQLPGATAPLLDQIVGDTRGDEG